MDFSSLVYWEGKYLDDGCEEMDWYVGWNEVEKHLLRLLGKDKELEIVVPGCGTSQIPVRLVENGYSAVTCFDFCEIVVDKMEAKFKGTGIDWVVMDATDLSALPNGCCDVIFDKALMDSICCAEDNLQRIPKFVEEMMRVLRVGGLYILVTYGPQQTRLPYFKDYAQVLETIKFPKPPAQLKEHPYLPKSHFMYVLKKKLP